jgi:hypothetical protein
VRPAVVEDDIGVSDISKPRAYEDSCRVEEERLRDVASKGIPVVLRN